MKNPLAAMYRAAKALARPLLGTVASVSTGERVAALTFDDGPSPDHTPRLLDVLARHGAGATFFMIGTRARQHPDLVERVAAAGHAIANHSWDHPSFAHVPARECRRQVRMCARALEPHGRRLFRSPGGHQTPWSALQVRLLLHDLIGWNVDPHDYTDRSAGEIAEQIYHELRPGSIVLLHDGIYGDPSADRSATVEAVDRILERHGRNWRFVTIPELLRVGRPRKINSFWHPDHDPFRTAEAQAS